MLEGWSTRCPPARDRAGEGPGELDVVVDTDILELTWSAGWGVGAARVPDVARAEVTLDGALLTDVAAGGLVRPDLRFGGYPARGRRTSGE